MTRAEAKALGRTRYFTGKPCKHGHVAERQVSNHACIECLKTIQRARYAATPEAWRAREQRATKQALREAYRRYCGAWYKANPEAQRWRGHRRGVALVDKGPLSYWYWLCIQRDGLSEAEWQAEVERMKAGTEVFRGDLRDPACEAFARRQAVAVFHARPPEFGAGNVVPIRPASRSPGQRGYAPWWLRG